MTAVHFHLALNHVPVILAPMAVIILVWGIAARRDDIQRVGLAVALAAGLLMLPVYFTGEGAEHTVEDFPAVSRENIEVHQDWALPAAVVTWVAGLLGLAGLGLMGRRRALAIATLVVSLGATAVVGYTAYRGGLIRHPEIAPGFTPPPGIGAEGRRPEGRQREGAS